MNAIQQMFVKVEPARIATIRARSRLAAPVSSCVGRGKTDIVLVYYRTTGTSIVVPVRNGIAHEDAATAFDVLDVSSLRIAVRHALDLIKGDGPRVTADRAILTAALNDLDGPRNASPHFLHPHTAEAMIVCLCSKERAEQIINVAGIDWSEDPPELIKACLLAAARALV